MKARNRYESDQAVEAMKRRGLKVQSVNPALEMEWRQAAEQAYPQIRGRIVPAEQFDDVKRLLSEYKESHAFSSRGRRDDGLYSAIVVVVPLLVPLGRAYGIDPIHLGVIFLANLELGYLIPPVGENLFISSYRFNKPIGEVYRATVPMILIFLVAVLLSHTFRP